MKLPAAITTPHRWCAHLQSVGKIVSLVLLDRRRNKMQSNVIITQPNSGVAHILCGQATYNVRLGCNLSAHIHTQTDFLYSNVLSIHTECIKAASGTSVHVMSSSQIELIYGHKSTSKVEKIPSLKTSLCSGALTWLRRLTLCVEPPFRWTEHIICMSYYYYYKANKYAAPSMCLYILLLRKRGTSNQLNC